ncbi:MAG: hypothetical protein EXR36_01815 [Betaproteobacteria bacterium]|nr:hypothetical protein [Betaproteobacteria bacterium]
MIADVYRVRGSAPEVRARIEAECKTELEEKAKLIALHEAMLKAGVVPAAQAAPANTSEARPAQQSASSQNAWQSAQQSREKKEMCDRLSRNLQSNRNRQRQGGGAEAMDKLNQERRDLERSFSDFECG